jgi:hypothetical protein
MSNFNSQTNHFPAQTEKAATQKSTILAIKPKPVKQDSPKHIESTSTEITPQVTQTDEINSDLVKPPVRKQNEQPSPSTEESTTTSEVANTSSKVENSDKKKLQKWNFKKPQPKKPLQPPYKNLEQVTNRLGETIAVGEQIKVSTCNYGEYTAAISFFYQATDGSVWARYKPVASENETHPWRSGCCRVEFLRKETLPEHTEIA